MSKANVDVRDEDNEIVFLSSYNGLLHGLVRTAGARMGLTLAANYFTEQESIKARSGKCELPDHFDDKAFDYVVTASLLVYCVSIFDVFLSDVTRGLLFSNIGALGKSCLVPIEKLASQKARNEIIKKEVEKKVRNVSYKGFVERLEFLATVCGIALDLEQKDAMELSRLSELRNRLVHDQSIYLFKLNRRHRPTVTRKRDITKPVEVTREDVDKADNLFLRLGESMVKKIDMKLFGHTNIQ